MPSTAMQALKRVLQGSSKSLNETNLRKAFHFFDADNSGEIDSAEFQVCRSLGPVLPLSLTARLKAAMRSLGFRCTALTANQIIASADQDGNGTINLEEWMGMLTRVQ